MVWNLTYETSGNHVINPFPINHVFPKKPVVLVALPIGQINLLYYVGRLTFLTSIPDLGEVKGNSQKIHRGTQIVNPVQLLSYSFTAQFYLYGYIPQLRILIYESDEDVANEPMQELAEIQETVNRIEDKVDGFTAQ